MCAQFNPFPWSYRGSLPHNGGQSQSSSLGKSNGVVNGADGSSSAVAVGGGGGGDRVVRARSGVTTCVWGQFGGVVGGAVLHVDHPRDSTVWFAHSGKRSRGRHLDDKYRIVVLDKAGKEVKYRDSEVPLVSSPLLSSPLLSCPLLSSPLLSSPLLLARQWLACSG